MTYNKATNSDVDNTTSISPELVQLGLFPNPNNGTFTLRYSGEKSGVVNLTILDVTGRVLFTDQGNKEMNTYEHTVILSNYTKGIYMLAVELAGNTTYQKFIIE